jgi:hypothetical protein
MPDHPEQARGRYGGETGQVYGAGREEGISQAVSQVEGAGQDAYHCGSFVEDGGIQHNNRDEQAAQSQQEIAGIDPRAGQVGEAK